MTTHKEALKLALEALDQLTNAADTFSVSGVYFNEEVWAKKCLSDAYFAITTIEEALAQPEQEPVAWKLVPTEPTDEMLKAMDECSTEGYDERLYAGHAASVYMAAVDVAPTPPKPEQEPVVWMYQDKSTHQVSFQKHMKAFVDHSKTSEVPLYGKPLANHELQCVCGAVWCGDEMVHLPNKTPPQPKQDKERCVGCEACIDTACGRDECPKGWPKAAQPEQEPVALQMDVIVVNLVREGINKHRARELAEHFIKNTPPQRKPLTDEEIMKIAKVSCIGISPHEDTLNFAKVIEAVHGIKE